MHTGLGYNIQVRPGGPVQQDGPRYLGIDLGTTNSAAAMFDGDELTLIRASDGATLTPSVVRIDKQGRVAVGSRARRFLERDPENTHHEFKRLMGTSSVLSFPASGADRTAEQLAAEVLRAIRSDVSAQLGLEPRAAVISVPALFELPQSAATSEAARQAGFEVVELIQEPVASALAAGWSSDENGRGSWLVYDMGGGTFDVSLLETRDGLLRVVGHDGDNFLGGRDIDRAVMDWALERLAADGHRIARDDPAMAPVLARLRSAAEEAKIDLTRASSTLFAPAAGLELGGTTVDVELELDRATLERLLEPVVTRSLAVCERLLATHGLDAEQLQRVVMVGGPTVIPALRDRVRETLATTFHDGLDPMTLVARGAAIYAATAGVDARPRPTTAPTIARRGRQLWLHYPAMSSDLRPHVVGRVLEGDEPAPDAVRFVRSDGGWTSEWSTVGPDGSLVAMLDLVRRTANTFRVEGRIGDAAIDVRPTSIRIVQGLTITDPPLSRSVGIALANDRVQVYLERGTPLPAKRTFVHHTVQSVATGERDTVLTIPVVQGELENAHLCRLVGRLEIAGTALSDTLPPGTEVEVTVEVDRGGRLHARALVPRTQQVFEQVAHLVVPDAPPETLALQIDSLKTRLEGSRGAAMRNHDAAAQDRLFDLEWRLQDAQQDVVSARGGDDDAAQRARRTLIEVDAELSEMEDASAWPELERQARHRVAWAVQWVETYGTPEERTLVQDAAAAVRSAHHERRGAELQRQLRVVTQLGTAAYFRDPQAWRHTFAEAAADVTRATDVVAAQRLVDEGRQAMRDGDDARLRGIVNQLWQLLPGDTRDRSLGHGSGLR